MGHAFYACLQIYAGQSCFFCFIFIVENLVFPLDPISCQMEKKTNSWLIRSVCAVNIFVWAIVNVFAFACLLNLFTTLFYNLLLYRNFIQHKLVHLFLFIHIFVGVCWIVVQTTFLQPKKTEKRKTFASNLIHSEQNANRWQTKILLCDDDD